MPANKQDNPADWPALGRAISWVDRPGNALKVVWMLAAACALVLAAGFTYEGHAALAAENLAWFYAAYGFAGFTGLIMLAKLLRVLVKRPEDYYADKAIDREDYPRDQLQIRNVGDGDA